jgi:hypothetical protein
VSDRTQRGTDPSRHIGRWRRLVLLWMGIVLLLLATLWILRVGAQLGSGYLIGVTALGGVLSATSWFIRRRLGPIMFVVGMMCTGLGTLLLLIAGLYWQFVLMFLLSIVLLVSPPIVLEVRLAGLRPVFWRARHHDTDSRRPVGDSDERLP